MTQGYQNYCRNDRFLTENYLLVIGFETVYSDSVFTSLERAAEFHTKLHQIHTMQSPRGARCLYCCLPLQISALKAFSSSVAL